MGAAAGTIAGGASIASLALTATGDVMKGSATQAAARHLLEMLPR